MALLGKLYSALHMLLALMILRQVPSCFMHVITHSCTNESSREALHQVVKNYSSQSNTVLLIFISGESLAQKVAEEFANYVFPFANEDRWTVM